MMGHGSKKMVFEVYGKYRKGLEQDYDKILAFFGKDFLVSEMQQAHWFTSAFGESLEKVGEKPSGPTHNYLILQAFNWVPPIHLIMHLIVIATFF